MYEQNKYFFGVQPKIEAQEPGNFKLLSLTQEEAQDDLTDRVRANLEGLRSVEEATKLKDRITLIGEMTDMDIKAYLLQVDATIRAMQR